MGVGTMAISPTSASRCWKKEDLGGGAPRLGGAGCHGIGRKEVHSLCLVERIGGRW